MNKKIINEEKWVKKTLKVEKDALKESNKNALNYIKKPINPKTIQTKVDNSNNSSQKFLKIKSKLNKFSIKYWWVILLISVILIVGIVVLILLLKKIF